MSHYSQTGELVITEDARTTNAKNGQFLKGHVPYNKGKKWSQYMGKRAQKRSSKGWSNLEKFRPKTRPDITARCSKQTVAVLDDGRFRVFSSIKDAALWIGTDQNNIGRCCRLNQSHRINRKTGAINTDHRFLGVRFYYETDDTWTTKIEQPQKTIM